MQGELISVAPNPAKESVSFTLEFPIVTDLPPRGDRHPQAGGEGWWLWKWSLDRNKQWIHYASVDESKC